MKVYRLEHPKYNRGPHTAVAYDPNTQAAWDLAGQSASAMAPTRPGPGDDLGYGFGWQKELCNRFCCMNAEIKFGCRSLESLKEWFDGELFELLLLAGHEVRIYEVPDEFVHIGKCQLAFRFMKG